MFTSVLTSPEELMNDVVGCRPDATTAAAAAAARVGACRLRPAANTSRFCR